MKLNEVIWNITLVAPNSVNYSKKLSGLLNPLFFLMLLKRLFQWWSSLASIHSLCLLVHIFSLAYLKLQAFNCNCCRVL